LWQRGTAGAAGLDEGPFAGAVSDGSAVAGGGAGAAGGGWLVAAATCADGPRAGAGEDDGYRANGDGDGDRADAAIPRDAGRLTWARHAGGLSCRHTATIIPALRGLDTGLVPVVGITPANAPEASVTGDITADLQAAGWRLSELHIDRAYLSSALVRDRGPDLQIFCKAWRVRNTGGRFAKDQFTLDFAAGQLTCPAGVAMSFQPARRCASPRAPARPARCGPVHHQQQRPQHRHPPR
jgi:hypothetical protein